jgi:hypothetical protein
LTCSQISAQDEKEELDAKEEQGENADGKLSVVEKGGTKTMARVLII